jgi:signal transduction histidine kinase
VEVGAGRVTVAVRDRGAGISAEDLPHIFERFYKSRGQQAVVPGLGLGLYISRELVLRHGGRLWAASRVGEGSTFYIDLPLLSQGPPV